MGKRLLKIALYVSGIFGFLKNALADGGNPPAISTITLTNPLNCPSNPGDSGFLCVAQNIINALFWIAIPITTITILVGAFQILTASGDETKFTAGRNTILYAVIGFGVVILALGGVDIIRSILGV